MYICAYVCICLGTYISIHILLAAAKQNLAHVSLPTAILAPHRVQLIPPLRFGSQDILQLQEFPGMGSSLTLILALSLLRGPYECAPATAMRPVISTLDLQVGFGGVESLQKVLG